jgi:hypothetical protein
MIYMLPERCPHDKAWEECCLEDLLAMNAHIKREDIAFSRHMGWIETKGHESKERSL